MAVTRKVDVAVHVGDTRVSGVHTMTDGAVKSIREAIPNGSTDLAVTANINMAKTSMLFIMSTYDMTLELNNGTTPEATLALRGGVPYIWHEDIGFPAQFGADDALEVLTNDTITTIYVTSDPTNSDTLIIENLYDPT